MRHHQVHRSHFVGPLSVIGLAKEEDLPSDLLAHLPGQISRAEPGIKRTHISIGLLESRLLGRCDSQITNHMQRMPATSRPAIHQRDHHFWHEPDQPLHLQDVQPATLGCRAPGVHGVSSVAVGVLVTRASPDPLIATRAKSPPAIFGRGPIAGQQHAANIRTRPSVIECGVQLVHCLRTKCIAHLGSVKGDPHRRYVQGTVVGDVSEVESRHRFPALRLPRRCHRFTVRQPASTASTATIGELGPGAPDWFITNPEST